MHTETKTQQLFRRNILLLLLVNLIVKPAYILLIDAQVQNVLGEETYGMFFSLFNFCILFQILLDPGIHNYNAQLIAKDNERAGQHFSNIAGSKLILTVLYSGVVMLAAIIIAFPASFYAYLPGILGIIVGTSFLNYLRSHFSALGYYSHEAVFSGLDKLLMILFIGYFLYYKKEIDLGVFISAQLVALFISCTVFVISLSAFIRLRLSFSIAATTRLVRETTPYALVLLLMTLYTRVDGVMLERLLDDNAFSAGLYARSFRLLDASNMIGLLFTMLMLPMFARLLQKKAALNALVEEISRLLFIIALTLCLVCWFYNQDIMNLIYIDNTDEHYKVFRYLMLAFFTMSLSNIFGCLFLASKKLKQINWVFFAGLVTNVLLNFILIPPQGAFGAVIASLATQFFVFMGQALLAFRSFELTYTLKTWTGFILLTAFSCLIFVLLANKTPLFWIIELALISFLVWGLAFLLRFISLSLVSARG